MKNTPHKSPRPFRKLGSRLRFFREQRSQSLLEVSGAVEVDTAILEQIESGEQRPSEELLLMLISYFDVTEEEAERLWNMAGFLEGSDSSQSADSNKQIAFIMPMDIRIVYTDLVHVSANNHGVVMNFMQTGGPNNQPLAVSRVGMSQEHAEHVIKILSQALDQMKNTPEPKALPPRSKDTLDES